MDEVVLRRSVKRWHDDTSLVKVPVVVCAAFGTFVGNTYHIEDQRLLDALNGGFVAKALRMGKDFMPLTEVEAYSPTGKRATHPCIYIRKSNILFVAERSDGQLERNSAKDAKGYLVRVKKPLSVRLYMPPYTIEGKLHVGVWQELAQVLDGDNKFLPLTDAVVSPALLTGESASRRTGAKKPRKRSSMPLAAKGS